MLSFDLMGKTIILMLESGKLTWEQFASTVSVSDRPKEYKDLASFTKNKGKVSKRLFKQDEWAKMGQE